MTEMPVVSTIRPLVRQTVPEPIGERRVVFRQLNWQAYQQILLAVGQS